MLLFVLGEADARVLGVRVAVARATGAHVTGARVTGARVTGALLAEIPIKWVSQICGV